MQQCNNCGTKGKEVYSQFLNAWMCKDCGYLMPNDNKEPTIPATLDIFLKYEAMRIKVNDKMTETADKVERLRLTRKK